MDTFGCTTDLLEFLWWQLDFTANEGLYMNQLEQFQTVFSTLQNQVSEHDPLDDYQIRKKIYEILIF